MVGIIMFELTLVLCPDMNLRLMKTLKRLLNILGSFLFSLIISGLVYFISDECDYSLGNAIGGFISGILLSITYNIANDKV
jgi:hypothetical protein